MPVRLLMRKFRYCEFGRLEDAIGFGSKNLKMGGHPNAFELQEDIGWQGTAH